MNLVIILGEILNIEYKIIDKGKVYAIAFSEIKIEMEKQKSKLFLKMIWQTKFSEIKKVLQPERVPGIISVRPDTSDTVRDCTPPGTGGHNLIIA